MNRVLIGNFISVIASSLMIYYGFLKDKKKILIAQIMECVLAVIYSIILGGYTAAVTDALMIILFIIGYKEKMNNLIKIIFSLIAIVISFFTCNLGIVSYIPVVILLIFLWGISTDNAVKFKILNMFCMILWVIHDLVVQNYVAVVCEIINILGCIYTLNDKKFINQKNIKEEPQDVALPEK